MKQKWRYNVRLAGRKDVIVRPMTANDLPAWHAMNVETGERDGFGIHAPAYYERAFELFPSDQSRAGCWLSSKASRWQPSPRSALAGKAWYMWGASSSLERQRMPNHALQWAAMQWAAEQGCHSYDFWGIPDEVGADPARYADDFAEQQGGLWGVYRFKQGFGGQIVRYTGAWDLPTLARRPPHLRPRPPPARGQ